MSSRVFTINPPPVPTAKLHVDVLRAYIKNPDGVVISFTRPGEAQPRIAVVGSDRLQEALDRAWLEFGK